MCLRQLSFVSEKLILFCCVDMYVFEAMFV
jgi:hypothetical protein